MKSLLPSMQLSAPRSYGLKTYAAAIFLLVSLLCTSRHLFYYQHSSRLPVFVSPNNNFEHEYYLNTSRASEQTAPRAPSVNFIDLAKQDLPFAPYNPYPDYNTRQWKKRWRGAHKACTGPRGVNVNGNPDDMLMATSVEPLLNLKANPEPMFGSYYEGGLDSRHCFDRKGRLAPYGFQSVEGKNTTKWAKPSKVDWDNVDWGSLQDQCVERNKDRYEYKPRASPSKLWYPTKKNALDINQTVRSDKQQDSGWFSSSAKKYKKRSALLLRSWDSLDYNRDILENVRAMITELSLHSGGEYSVYVMVHIKDKEQAIFDSPHEYQKALTANVPRELHNISILFNVPLLEAWYPLISQDTGGNGQDQEHHMDQPLQLFSLLHPEFDQVWQMEIDNRYTGHWYNFFENAAAWSRNQPRKLQWERHSKYYMPSVHSTYANLSAVVEEENPKGGIWGPLRSGTGTKNAVPSPAMPAPEGRVQEEDHYIWGVGEDADLLSPAPIIDAHPSASGPNQKVYTPIIPQNFPGDPDIPLRFLPYVPMVRVSKRLLRVMHASQVETGIDLIPETMPATLAILHGFKVAFFPLPNYLDDENGEVRYSPDNVEKQMNGVRDNTPWKVGTPREMTVMREHMTCWWSLDPEGQYPKRLYRKWLGGREQESLQFRKKLDEDEVKKEGDQGRLCLPGILLHPVK